MKTKSVSCSTNLSMYDAQAHTVRKDRLDAFVFKVTVICGLLAALLELLP